MSPTSPPKPVPVPGLRSIHDGRALFPVNLSKQQLPFVLQVIPNNALDTMAMATRPTLPYYAPDEELPAPLPTVTEILAATQAQRLSLDFQTRVYRIGDHYAVKYGLRTSTQEGENMLFVQQSTSIPVPKVYAIFEADVHGLTTSFIVMDYVPGNTLARSWPTLDAAQKRGVVSQLRAWVDELRRIPSPGYYGGLWRQPVRDVDFEDKRTGLLYPQPEIAGPHDTEEQFVDAMWRCLDNARNVAAEDSPAVRVRRLAYIRRQYHAIFKGHRPVFAHANFYPGNVMLKPDGSLVVIDWEHAGWYPSFWEYCGTLMLLDHLSDWNDWAHEVFSDKYVAELGWFSDHRYAILNS